MVARCLLKRKYKTEKQHGRYQQLFISILNNQMPEGKTANQLFNEEENLKDKEQSLPTQLTFELKGSVAICSL